jgi:hypothetical protein
MVVSYTFKACSAGFKAHNDGLCVPIVCCPEFVHAHALYKDGSALTTQAPLNNYIYYIIYVYIYIYVCVYIIYLPP